MHPVELGSSDEISIVVTSEISRQWRIKRDASRNKLSGQTEPSFRGWLVGGGKKKRGTERSVGHGLAGKNKQGRVARISFPWVVHPCFDDAY